MKFEDSLSITIFVFTIVEALVGFGASLSLKFPLEKKGTERTLNGLTKEQQQNTCINYNWQKYHQKYIATFFRTS